MHDPTGELRRAVGALAVAVACAVWVAPAWGQQGEPPSPPATGDEPDETDDATGEPAEADPPGEADETDGDGADDPEPGLSEEELRLLQESVEADVEAEDGGGADVVGGAGPPPAVQVSLLDLALILDVAAAYFSDEPLQLGGHDPSETGFNFQQLELSASGNVDPFLRFDANLVFSPFGVEVEEAYVTTLALPANLQMRAGQFLTRFGRLNPTHPHAWSFADQPLVNGKFFGGEGSRGLGVEASWLSPLPWYVEVVGSATDAAGECCARSFFGATDLGVDSPAELLYTAAIEQFFPLSPSWSLAWGLSGQFGPNPTGQGNRSEIYGTDLYLRYRPVASTSRSALSLTVEAMVRQRQVPDDVLRDQGGYAQLVWTIDPEWETGGRYEVVSGVEDDPLDPEWDEARQRTSAEVTYYPSHFSRLRLQVAHDAPGWRPDPIWSTFLTLEVIVGAHGAHEY